MKEKINNIKNVFPVGFYDPVADYMELISNVDIKIFLSDDGSFHHPSKMHCCMLGFHFFWVKIKDKFNRSSSDIASLEA